MSIEANKTLVRHCIAAINQQDLGAFDQLISADYRGHIAGFPPIDGLAALKYTFSAYYAAFPDFHVERESELAEGDLVVERVTFSGTHRGELMGIPATGKHVIVSGIHLYRIVDGKMAEEWVEQDTLGLLQQLGALPPMGQ